MRLILIRHAQKSDDGGLTVVGEEQARELGRKLQNERIGVVFCSPRLRCEKTLDAILEGRGEEEIDIRFSRLVGPKTTDEALDKFQNRVKTFLTDLEIEFEDEVTVMVVSHQRVIGELIRVCTGGEEMVDEAAVKVVELLRQ